MAFLANQAVAWESYTAGATDVFGNATDGWAASVDVSVFGWAPAGSTEPFETGRDAVTWDVDLFVPATFTPGPHDRITVDGEVYEVDGGVQDFTNGPFTFTPGAVVRLKRTEG